MIVRPVRPNSAQPFKILPKNGIENLIINRPSSATNQIKLNDEKHKKSIIRPNNDVFRRKNVVRPFSATKPNSAISREAKKLIEEDKIIDELSEIRYEFEGLSEDSVVSQIKE